MAKSQYRNAVASGEDPSRCPLIVMRNPTLPRFGTDSLPEDSNVKDVTLVGGIKLKWSEGERGLSVKLPEKLPGAEVGLRIRGVL